MKKPISLLLCVLLLALAACTDPVIGDAPGEKAISADPASAPEAVIELQGDSIRYSGTGGVAVSGSIATIGAPGSYTVRGTLSDGRIIVNLRENPGKVTLFLDGADLCCRTDSAIYVMQAKELKLVLAAGSENRVVSGTEDDLASYDETRQGAAIFAEDDLDIQGEGALTVLGYLNNGITCKDDIQIKGGRLTVQAANNGIRASESVTVTGGTVKIEAGNDGMKATSAKKEGKGFVQIDDGSLTIRSKGDGLSAETSLTVNGGTLDIETEGGRDSCKGLKARTSLTVNGGTVSVIAADDGLSCDDTVRVTGGELSIRAGADGIQGGKKGTGFAAEVGTVSIEGGHAQISAFHKAVDAKARFLISGGSLFACGGILEPVSELPWLLFSVEGTPGSVQFFLSRDEALAIDAAYAFHSVFYVGPALSEGESYTLQLGSQTLTGTAVK